jgi:murein peptide amidase A
VVLAGNYAGTLASNCNEDQTFTEGAAPSLESADSCGLGAGSLSGVDPDLAPLADNGGPTPTHGLYPGSPALDRAPACGLATDQRGTARDAACDLGSFEGTVPRPPPPAAPGGTTAAAPKQAKKKKKRCKRRKRGKRGCSKGKGGKKRRARPALLLAGAAESRVIGHSVSGRPIVARRFGAADAERVGLVVGVIHGDERAGIGIAKRLRGLAGMLGDSQLWVIDSLNPDGSRLRARRNARGVDLNRNFPFRWRGGIPRASGYYPGSGPASEPETRAAIEFIREIEPDVSVWYHQPWGAVLACRGRPPLAARYARLAGTGTSCRGRGLRGTAIGWENETIPGSTAFVVELPGRGLHARAALRHARAAATILRDG